MRSGKDAVMFRLASVAYSCGVTPNMLTALGLSLGIASGVFFAVRGFPYAFTFGLLSVFCDVLDGTVARKFHLESTFGLLFDSAADRASEFAVVAGALVAGIIQPLGFVAVVGSFSLFIMRSVSHKRGQRTDYAVFGRFERLAFILAGLIVPFPWLSTVCFVVAGSFGLVSSVQIALRLHKTKSGAFSK